MIRFVLTTIAVLFTHAAVAKVDIQAVTSPNGFDAWLVEEHSIPFVALEIRFKGGASLDAPNKRGAAHFMTGLLEEGAGDLNSTEFTTQLEELAASFGFDIFADSLTVSASFLSENRDESVALLKSALSEPRFDQDAIERVRAQILSIISSDQQDPATLANVNFDRLAFGEHPYGSSKEGTLESVASLTREDIVTAFNDLVAKDRVFVGAVGDITADELGTLLDDLFADLPEVGADQPERADYLLAGGTTVVPFNTPQSVAVFGHEGIKRDDPDFFPAYILNQVVGAGGFGSRLMEEVREKRGLTYGVYSYLAPMDHAELYRGQVASANDRIAEAITVIRDQWQQISEQGLTEAELERAKKYLTGAYPLRFDGNTSIARILVGMQVDGLPLDYIETRNAKVEAVTQEDIKRVAARLLQPDELHFVVVGQPEGL